MRRSNTMRMVLTGCLLAMAPLAWADGSGSGGSTEMPGFGGHRIEHNLVLPQIAIGAHYSTSIVLTNLGTPMRMTWADAADLTTRGTVHLFHQDGTPYTASFNGGEPVSEFPFELASGHSLFLKLTNDGADTPGWALIDVEDDATTASTDAWGEMNGQAPVRGMRLAANAFYSLHGDGAGLVSQVGVMPAVYEMGWFTSSLLPAQREPGVNTGVAVVNTGTDAATIDLGLNDLDGNSVATGQLTVEGGHQVAKFITELFPGLVPDSFQGTLTVSASGEGVVTLGLLQAEGVLTSIPSHHFGTWTETGMGGGMGGTGGGGMGGMGGGGMAGSATPGNGAATMLP